jgi:glycosyltransferase involved in cell wall biosynthesis
MLALAAWQGIPVRIAHSHNDLRHLQRTSNVRRRAYYRATEHLVSRFATTGLAPSVDAALSLFGPEWRSDSRYRLLQYGIELSPFATQVDRDAVRAGLGIAPESDVFGHVGSFTPQKNHTFLLDVFRAVHVRRPNARLLLVGDGPLLDSVLRQAESLGIGGLVVFAGVRPDVPALMMGAMDCFLFPSTHEGLGIVLIEAQAAGLPSLTSDVVPVEADAVPGLVRRMSLSEGPDAWANAAVDLLQTTRRMHTVAGATSALAGSAYDIIASARAMEHVYARTESILS